MYAETIEARTKCEECGKAIVEGYIDIEMAPSRPKEPARHPAPALARRLPGKIQDQTPFTTAAGLFKNETTRRQGADHLGVGNSSMAWESFARSGDRR